LLLLIRVVALEVAVDFPVISMTLNAYVSIPAARCCATREVESLTDRLRGLIESSLGRSRFLLFTFFS